MRILIVDDNKEITYMLSRFLKAKGFEIDTLNDSTKVIDSIKKVHYDTVILDILMPEITGFDIVVKLEKEMMLSNQKIIILSAISFNPNQINWLSEKKGIHGCLKKPTRLGEILTAITA